MSPGKRRDLGKQFGGNIDALGADIFDNAAEIDSVPQDNSVDDEVKTSGPIGHGFRHAVAQLAELVKEDCPGKGVTAFILVEDGMRSAPELGVEQPVADEDRAFNPAHFA